MGYSAMREEDGVALAMSLLASEPRKCPKRRSAERGIEGRAVPGP
jgi:hypothetical protein